MAIFIDPEQSPSDLRQMLYDGHLVILTRLPSVTVFVKYTRDQLTDLFGPYEPEHAHEHFDKAEMARMLGVWKPRFIHSEVSEELVCNIIRETGLRDDTTYYDVPKPRTAFPSGHLTTGIAYAFPWHRDVWYSAPAQQINWWLPVYRVRQDNAMTFDLQKFDQAVSNSSSEFDYYENNVARLTTASNVTREKQVRPAATQHRPATDLPVLPAPGQVLLFSGAQLHATIPNTSARSRFSVDFRTVDITDVESRRGARVVDSDCRGTAIRDFHRVSDGAPLDEQFVTRLFGEPPPGSMLVFQGAESDD
jgi:hypothetical protein